MQLIPGHAIRSVVVPSLDRRLLATLALALGVIGVALSAPKPAMSQLRPPPDIDLPRLQPEKIAIFGKDNRRRLPRHLRSLRGSIGLVYSNNARSVCTGFCVADNVIATASHCLFRTAGERRPKLRAFRFILRAAKGQPSVAIAGGRSNSADQFVIAGSRRLRVEPPIDATKDWALMRLQKPLCRGNVLPLAPSAGQRTRSKRPDNLLQVSFHHDYGNWKLAYSGKCKSVSPAEAVDRKRIARDFTAPGPLLLHSCDTGGASSGSPILQLTRTGKLGVIAINVGTYIQTRMLIEDGKVVRRFKSYAIANTAVLAEAFSASLNKFADAEILSTAKDIRALQTELKAGGFYHGRVDGAFGPATRQAIQAFRGIPGLELAGLPTRNLLKSLLPAQNRLARPIDQRQTKPATGRQTLSGGRLRKRIKPSRR